MIKTKSGKNTKGQAALEFLTTYGWAFLVILIMIAALAYFGILSPSKILPSRCNFGAEFECVDYQVRATAPSEVRLRLKNGAGEPVDVSSISVGSDGIVSLTCTNPVVAAAWKSGETKDMVFTTCTNTAAAGLISGEKGKVNITMNYFATSSGATYTKQVKGEVFTTII